MFHRLQIPAKIKLLHQRGKGTSNLTHFCSSQVFRVIAADSIFEHKTFFAAGCNRKLVAMIKLQNVFSADPNPTRITPVCLNINYNAGPIKPRNCSPVGRKLSSLHPDGSHIIRVGRAGVNTFQPHQNLPTYAVAARTLEIMRSFG
mmetsp:Transcript_29871/g.58538  ORF Transcript_29871/g.58538 Transcript_29871/m.58538 type:complete len:146 (-) Transcript_29871:2123-2560(-)